MSHLFFDFPVSTANSGREGFVEVSSCKTSLGANPQFRDNSADDGFPSSADS